MSAQPGLVHDGNYLVTFCDTLANPNAPKVSELNSGIELQCQITPDGLTREAEDEAVDTSRLCSVFTTQRVGRTSFEVSLTLVRLDENVMAVGETDEAFHALKKGKTGYLVIRDNKPATAAYAAGDDVEVFYVEAGTRNKATPAANEQMTFTVPFMVLADPWLESEVVTP